MAEGFVGHTAVYIGRGSTTPVKIQGAADVNWPDSQTEQIEITDQDSTAREFMLGLVDNGEVSFDINWIPGSEQDELLRDIRTSRELLRVRFSATPMGGTTEVYTETYAAILTGFSRVSPVGDKYTATITFRINNEIVTP